jgi:type IV secretion system protein VirB6
LLTKSSKRRHGAIEVDGWTIFQALTDQLDGPLRDAVDGIINGLFPSVTQGFQVGLTIWLALLGYRIGWGRGGDAIGTMLSSFVYAAAVSAAMTVAVYHDDIEAVAFDLPNQIATAIGGGEFGANSFDDLSGRAWAGGLRVWQHLDWRDIGMQFLVVVFWLVSAISIAAGFGIWLASHLILSLLIAIGPLFIVLFLFPPFRGYCERWIGAVLSMITLQVLIAALLTLMIESERTLLGTLAQADGASPLPGARMLISAAILFIICAMILRELPGVAVAIAGGVHFGQAGRMTQATLGRAASLARAGAGGVAGAVSGSSAGVRSASNRPPGQSISSP